MSRLLILIAEDNPERLRTALVLACTSAALGQTVRMFFQGRSVALLHLPITDPDEEGQASAGLPTLGQLVDEATALGVSFACCQSSLAMLGLTPAAFSPDVAWGGMTGLLAEMTPEDRLVAI